MVLSCSAAANHTFLDPFVVKDYEKGLFYFCPFPLLLLNYFLAQIGPPNLTQHEILYLEEAALLKVNVMLLETLTPARFSI